MGDVTTHGLPYPEGTDRVVDGDDAIQALAEAVDTALWAGADASALAPGIWQNADSTVICTSDSLAAAPGASITRARWMKLGRTVWFQGEAIMSNAVTNVAVSLPNTTAGVPLNRALSPGVCYLLHSSIIPQSSTGELGASKDRLIPISGSGAYMTAPAASELRWSIVYEVSA